MVTKLHRYKVCAIAGLLAVMALALPSWGTPVQFIVTDSSGRPSTARLTIKAVNPLLQADDYMVAGWTITTNLNAGKVIVELEPNDYQVSLDGVPKSGRISVFETNGVVNATALTSGTIPTYTYTNRVIGTIPLEALPAGVVTNHDTRTLDLPKARVAYAGTSHAADSAGQLNSGGAMANATVTDTGNWWLMDYHGTQIILSSNAVRIPTNLFVDGTIVSGTLSGNGSGLSNLQAVQLTGIIPPANLPGIAFATNAEYATRAGYAQFVEYITNRVTFATNAESAQSAALSAAVSGTLTNGINTPGTVTAAAGSFGSLGASGTISAATFSGSGSGLTAIPAGQLTGTMPANVLPYPPQMGAPNLTNWATLAPSSKQDTLVYQPATNGAPIAATQLTGTILDARLSGNVAFLANVTDATNQLASVTSNRIAAAVSSIPASVLTGTIDPNRLPGIAFATNAAYVAGTLTNAINTPGTVTASTFTGSGSGLTSLPAGQLSGTVADARLSANVPLLSGGKVQIAGGVYSSGGNNFFADATGGYWANGLNNYAVGWYEASGAMKFRTDTKDRITISAGGPVTISSNLTALGTLTTGTAGGFAVDAGGSVTASKLLLGTTSSAGSKLQVSGSGAFTGWDNNASGANGIVGLFAGVYPLNNNSPTVMGFDTVAGVWTNLFLAGNSVKIQNNSTTVATFTNSNLLLGTITDNGSRLQINGKATVGITPGSAGTLEFIPLPASPVSARVAFGGDGTGWGLRFARNTAGTYTDLMTLTDTGNLLLNTTSDNGYRLQVSGNQTINYGANSSVDLLKLQVVGTDILKMSYNKEGGVAGPATFNTDSSTRALVMQDVSKAPVIIGTTNNNGAALQVSSATGDVGSSSGVTISGTGTGAQTWQFSPTASQTLLLSRPGLRLAAFGNDGSFSAGGLGGASGSSAAFIVRGSGGNGNVIVGSTTDNDNGSKFQVSASGVKAMTVTGNDSAGFNTIHQSSAGGVAIGSYNAGGATNNAAMIQGLNWNGSAYGTLLLNPIGQNVLIGQTTDNGTKLQVGGTATFGGNVWNGLMQNSGFFMGGYGDYSAGIGTDSSTNLSLYTKGLKRFTIGQDGVTTISSNLTVGGSVSNIVRYLDARRDFGAKGDGSTDDTAALQAALNSLTNNAANLRTLRIPAGVYKITSTLRFPHVMEQYSLAFYPGAGRVRVEGEGYGVTILSSTSTTAPAIDMGGNNDAVVGHELANLSIHGPNIANWKSAGANCFGIAAGGPTNFFAGSSFKFENLVVCGFYNGIVCSNLWQPVIDRCLLYSNYWSGAELYRTHFFEFRACEIDGYQPGRALANGIRIYGDSAGVEGSLSSTSISYATNGIYNEGVTLSCWNSQLQDCSYYIKSPYPGCVHWVGGGISELFVKGDWDMTNGYPGGIYMDSYSASSIVLDNPHFEWNSSRPLYHEVQYSTTGFQMPIIRNQNSLPTVWCSWMGTNNVNVPIQNPNKPTVSGQFVVRDAPAAGGVPAAVITGSVAMGGDLDPGTPYGGSDSRWINSGNKVAGRGGAIYGPRATNGEAWDVPILGWYDFGYGTYSIALGYANNAYNSAQWIDFRTGTAGSAGALRWRVDEAGNLANKSTGTLDTGAGGVKYPQQSAAPSAATIGGTVGSVTNHMILCVGGKLMDYWSDGTTRWEKQLAP